MMRMMRIWIFWLQSLELCISSAVHLLYGFYMFSSAIVGDLLLSTRFRHNANACVVSSADESLPPIVLVHGIFGFGQGVM